MVSTLWSVLLAICEACSCVCFHSGCLPPCCPTSLRTPTHPPTTPPLLSSTPPRFSSSTFSPTPFHLPPLPLAPIPPHPPSHCWHTHSGPTSYSAPRSLISTNMLAILRSRQPALAFVFHAHSVSTSSPSSASSPPHHPSPLPPLPPSSPPRCPAPLRDGAGSCRR